MPDGRRFRGRRRGLLAHVREHRSFAIVLAPVILGLGLTIQRVPEVFAGPGADLPVRLASLSLLGATLLYLTSWFFGSYLELDAVERLGEDFLQYVPRSELPIIIGTAIALGSLGLASGIVVAFAGLLFAIKAIELWSSWPLYNLVRQNADAAEQSKPGEAGLSPGLHAGIGAVRKYYLERPWVQVSVVVISLVAASLALAAFSAGTSDHDAFVVGSVVAAIGVLVAMALQEAFTWRWRLRYIRDLDDAERLDLDDGSD